MTIEEKIAQVKRLIADINKDIQYLMATYWCEEDRKSEHYINTLDKLLHQKILAECRLEQAFIEKTKTELELRKKELKSR